MKRLILIFLIPLIAACAGLGTPPADTNEKRLAAAEITWKNILTTVDLSVDRMSPDQARTIYDNLPKGEEALKAAHLALSVGNQLDFDDQIKTMNTSISLLKAILETLETTENRYGLDLKRYHAAGPSPGGLQYFSRSWRFIQTGGGREPECIGRRTPVPA